MTWEPSNAWRDSYDSWKLATPPEYEGEDEESDDGTELCPNCNVEWADRENWHNCDICGNTGRVLKCSQEYGPNEAEIDKSQALIGAILGPDADDEIAF